MPRDAVTQSLSPIRRAFRAAALCLLPIAILLGSFLLVCIFKPTLITKRLDPTALVRLGTSRLAPAPLRHAAAEQLFVTYYTGGTVTLEQRREVAYSFCRRAAAGSDLLKYVQGSQGSGGVLINYPAGVLMLTQDDLEIDVVDCEERVLFSWLAGKDLRRSPMCYGSGPHWTFSLPAPSPEDRLGLRLYAPGGQGQDQQVLWMRWSGARFEPER